MPAAPGGPSGALQGVASSGPNASAGGAPAGASSVSLEITLYGPACALYAWVLGALDLACRQGLGKARAPWAFERVLRVRPGETPDLLGAGPLSALGSTLEPDYLDLRLAAEPATSAGAAEPAPPPSARTAEPAPAAVSVAFLSPTRLLRDGRFVPDREPVPFGLLVARILDRFAGLYGREASDLVRAEARAALEAEAARVPILGHDTCWVEVHDYSARSRSEMLLGGKVGRMVYGEGAARFLPILRAGEILHVGKNAASGCGRIEARAVGG